MEMLQVNTTLLYAQLFKPLALIPSKTTFDQGYHRLNIKQNRSLKPFISQFQLHYSTLLQIKEKKFPTLKAWVPFH